MNNFIEINFILSPNNIIYRYFTIIKYLIIMEQCKE